METSDLYLKLNSPYQKKVFLRVGPVSKRKLKKFPRGNEDEETELGSWTHKLVFDKFKK